MRVLIFVLVLVAVLCICEGRRHKKRDNLIEKGQKVGVVRAPSSNPYHVGRKYHRNDRLRGQHLFGNKHKKKKDRHGRWMKFGNTECKTTKCSHKEFCIVHPKKLVEKCISKHDFREGRRLFRQFRKQKKHLNDETQIKQLEKELMKGENLQDVFDLISHHIEIKRNKHRQQKHKHVKDIEEKQDSMFKEAINEHECRPTEISELKKRLIGWFDVVHTLSRQEHHRRQHHKKNRNYFDKAHLFGGSKQGHPMREHHKSLDDVKLVKKGRADHKEQQSRYMLKRTRRSAYDIVEKEAHGGCMCSKSVMWEFHKQDVNKDGHLTEPELFFMESNRREPCMKALAKSCDRNRDGNLTRGEWCCCFQEIVAPCTEKKRTSNPAEWVPRCDDEGYFMREQCNTSGYCWCMDLNGNYIENTKTKGKPNCGKYGPNGYEIKQ